MNLIKELSDNQKGVLFIIAGVLLFFHVFNILNVSVNVLILVAAVLLILRGLALTRGTEKIKRLFKKH